jgi:hypothetical protein
MALSSLSGSSVGELLRLLTIHYAVIVEEIKKTQFSFIVRRDMIKLFDNQEQSIAIKINSNTTSH